jgi:hypothetical protein
MPGETRVLGSSESLEERAKFCVKAGNPLEEVKKSLAHCLEESGSRRVTVTICSVERNGTQKKDASQCCEKKKKKRMQVRVRGRASLCSCFSACAQTISEGDPDHVASKLSKETIVSKSQFSFLY